MISGPGGDRARLTPTGPAVGMLPGLAFGVGHERVAAGETLVAFTDGVTDAVMADGGRYSEQRLLDVLSGPVGTARQTVGRLREDLGLDPDTPSFDDITLLVAHRQPTGTT